jgi:hypothetical protein
MSLQIQITEFNILIYKRLIKNGTPTQYIQHKSCNQIEGYTKEELKPTDKGLIFCLVGKTFRQKP